MFKSKYIKRISMIFMCGLLAVTIASCGGSGGGGGGGGTTTSGNTPDDGTPDISNPDDGTSDTGVTPIAPTSINTEDISTCEWSQRDDKELLVAVFCYQNSVLFFVPVNLDAPELSTNLNDLKIKIYSDSAGTALNRWPTNAYNAGISYNTDYSLSSADNCFMPPTGVAEIQYINIDFTHANSNLNSCNITFQKEDTAIPATLNPVLMISDQQDFISMEDFAKQDFVKDPAKFELNNDIDLQQVDQFNNALITELSNVHFDGTGKAINLNSQISVSRTDPEGVITSPPAAIIGKAYDVVLKNFTLNINANISGTVKVGALIGSIPKALIDPMDPSTIINTTLDNINVNIASGITISGETMVGGLVGAIVNEGSVPIASKPIIVKNINLDFADAAKLYIDYSKYYKDDGNPELTSSYVSIGGLVGEANNTIFQNNLIKVDISEPPIYSVQEQVDNVGGMAGISYNSTFENNQVYITKVALYDRFGGLASKTQNVTAKNNYIIIMDYLVFRGDIGGVFESASGSSNTLENNQVFFAEIPDETWQKVQEKAATQPDSPIQSSFSGLINNIQEETGVTIQNVFIDTNYGHEEPPYMPGEGHRYLTDVRHALVKTAKSINITTKAVVIDLPISHPEVISFDKALITDTEIATTDAEVKKEILLFTIDDTTNFAEVLGTQWMLDDNKVPYLMPIDTEELSLSDEAKQIWLTRSQEVQTKILERYQYEYEYDSTMQ